MSNYIKITDVELTDQPTGGAPRQAQKSARNGAAPSASANSEQHFTHEVRTKRWWSRMGKKGWLILALGMVVIIISCTALALLWNGAVIAASGKEPTELWKAVVFNDWAPTVITICPAAIRTSMMLQVGLITAAISALMLENSRVSLADAAVVSIERAASTGPFAILFPAARQGNNLPGLYHLLFVIAALGIMVTSTFFSTILLSDFQTLSISGPATNITVSVAFRNDGTELRGSGVSLFKSSPATYWRTTLEYYNGPVIIANSRTFCSAPDFETLKIYNTDSDELLGVQVNASIPIGKHLKGDTYKDAVFQMRFDCRLARIGGHYKGGSRKPIYDSDLWPLTFCPGRTWDGDGFKGLSEPVKGTKYMFHGILIVNSSQTIYEQSVDVGNLSPVYGKGGVWTSIKDNSSFPLFNASLCFTNVAEPAVYNATMRGQPILQEPEFNWNSIKWNTSSIRRQLGIPRHTARSSTALFTERGIMQLISFTLSSEEKLWWTVSAHGVLMESLSVTLETRGWNMLNGAYLGETWSTRSPEHEQEQWTPHSAHVTLFQDILQTTGDVSRAAQAMVARLHQMAYYESENGYNLEYPVTTVSSRSTYIPLRWTGFSIVQGVIALHLALLLTTMVLFLTRTRASSLGNAWQTVAQVVSPHTKEIVDKADRLMDDEVRERTVSTGADVFSVGIRHSADTSRVEIRPAAVRARGLLGRDRV
ncbi:hypothetical protein CNYM01_00044 [Colletotrichum nymphaeae SA-01]|uniref:Uncharacterized protein n=1 Tax=Colletotrichum nymphaeae SA-01 TaxID=1460502 RepID=A0A135UJN8_9PEZI|nr:hypothetical protein CNYM01_00044 [Colletotrichum nymphaeae SA-01]